MDYKFLHYIETDNKMSLERHMLGEKTINFFEILSACIANVGSENFNKFLLEVIENVVRADQCMIFSYKEDKPKCYLSFNARFENNAKGLAFNYLDGGYEDDPLRFKLNQLRQNNKTLIYTFAEIEDEMPTIYKQQFYTDQEVIDTISILTSGHGDTILISFSRYAENGIFSRSEKAIRDIFWDIIAQVILLHYTLSGKEHLRGPLNSLSKREKNTCEGILRGLTTDAIAFEMGVASSTVTTYRKRSYAKLGINSKTSLFALCS